MNLYLASIIATFGRRSTWRLSALLFGAALIGYTGLNTVADIPLRPLSLTWPFVAGAAFGVQVVVLFTLVAAVGVLKESQDVFSRLLRVLPTTIWQKWLVKVLPAFVIGVLTLVCLAPAMVHILGSLGVPVVYSCLSLLFGLITALGLFYALPPLYVFVHIAFVPLVLWIEYILVQAATNFATTEDHRLYGLLLFSLIQILLVGLLFFSGRYPIRISSAHSSHHLFGRSLPRQAWLIKKILRASTTKLGFLAAFGISLFVATTGSQQATVDPAFLSFVAALMAASFSSDIRSTSRQFLPAEITALKGTRAFVAAQLISAMPVALIAVLPLIVVIALHVAPLESMALLAKLLLSTAIGLFAGTLIVPQKRDIAGQFLASLLCIFLLFVIPQFTFMASFTAGPQIVSYVIWYIVFAAVIHGIEKKRNYYKWKGTTTHV